MAGVVRGVHEVAPPPPSKLFRRPPRALSLPARPADAADDVLVLYRSASHGAQSLIAYGSRATALMFSISRLKMLCPCTWWS